MCASASIGVTEAYEAAIEQMNTDALPYMTAMHDKTIQEAENRYDKQNRNLSSRHLNFMI